MLNEIFGGVFDSSARNVEVGAFLICIAVSLAAGAVLAAAYSFRARHSRSFLTALALLPAVVCVVIMMVNGSVGAGVAVAGAFSLVRFRSAQGTAREIGAIFIAMSTGLMTGMGYLGLAMLFTLILCGMTLLYSWLGKWKSGSGREKVLHITIPENLEYDGVFDEVLDQFAYRYELISVKTTNMGSLFRLTYQVALKKDVSEKELIDQLRRRNGNLEIQLGALGVEVVEL